MSQVESPDQVDLILPPSVITKVDLSRLISEVETLDNDLNSAALRARAGASSEVQPEPSDPLSDFLAVNNLQLGEGPQRSQLISTLRRLKEAAPTVHMTFAAPTDQESLQQLAGWLRKSVHPLAVIEVGLQPSLIGGVYLRTTNQVHDLSIRAQLARHRGVLVEQLEALSGGR